MNLFATILTMLSFTLVQAQDVSFEYKVKSKEVFSSGGKLNYPYSKEEIRQLRDSIELSAAKQCRTHVKSLRDRWESFSEENNYDLKDLSIKLENESTIDLLSFSSCSETYQESGSQIECTASSLCDISIVSNSISLFVGKKKIVQKDYIKEPFSEQRRKEEQKRLAKKCVDQKAENYAKSETLFFQILSNDFERDYSRDLIYVNHTCESEIIKLQKRVQ